MVEWLERLGYGAESRRKGRIMQQKERDGLCLSSAVPKTQWDSHCPVAMGNLYL